MSDYDRPRAMADAVVEQATANPGEKRHTPTASVFFNDVSQVCGICGCRVGDPVTHMAWHAEPEPTPAGRYHRPTPDHLAKVREVVESAEAQGLGVGPTLAATFNVSTRTAYRWAKAARDA